MPARRFDVGTLGKPEKTPQGGLRVPAYLTRTGVFQYTADDGKVIREYRPPEEVFHVDSLATLKGAPLTLGHPPSMVSPDNFDKFTVGHVGDEVKQDGSHVAAIVTIQGRRAIAAVEKGIKQVSCGYECRIDEIAGVTPTGEPYDRIQRDIRANHVSLVAVGRAGSAMLRLDSAGNELPDTGAIPEERTMKTERIDGVDYEIGTDAHRAACQRRDEQKAERKAKIAALESDVAKATARADAAEAKLKDADKRIAELSDPVRLDALVRERVDLVEKARPILGAEFKFDGLSVRQIKEAAIAKVQPDCKLEGRHDDAVTVLFDAFVGPEGKKRLDAQANGAVRAAVVANKREDEKPPIEQELMGLKRKAREDSLNAWKQPLAATTQVKG